MAIRIEWKGEAVARDLRQAVDRAALEAAKKVAADARRLVPKDSGDLATSIKAEKSKFKGGGAVVVAGEGQQYYGSFIELGRRNAPAQPFMRPALERNRRTFTNLVRAEMAKGGSK